LIGNLGVGIFEEVHDRLKIQANPVQAAFRNTNFKILAHKNLTLLLEDLLALLHRLDVFTIFVEAFRYLNLFFNVIHLE